MQICLWGFNMRKLVFPNTMTYIIVHSFIRCNACRVPADLLKVQPFVPEFSIKYHPVHANPLKYGLAVVALVNTIVHFEHMKDNQYTLPWYLIGYLEITDLARSVRT